MGKIRIDVLEPKHKSLLKQFRNQEPSLEQYLRRFALRHSSKDLLSKTYLAILPLSSQEEQVAGYFSLSAVSVDRATVSTSAAPPSLHKLPGFPIPGVLLAQLAVDERAQGQGLGSYLFDEALGKTLELARQGTIGVRVLVADAIGERARQFYERRGLTAISNTYPMRMVLDLKAVIAEH